MEATEQSFLTVEHQTIFEQTSHLPGWQLPGDSFKLYEMGYSSGEIILEIGTYGGRSAVVELRGALANPKRTQKPQFYGIDIDICGIWRTYNSLEEAGLNQYALLYHGDLEAFLRDFSIQPTMVFLDGDHRYPGVKHDLQLLSNFLSPNTIVLCHDYLNPENDTGHYGVRQAVDEFVADGYARSAGTFGCSAFLITSEKCQGQAIGQGLHPEEFARRRRDLLETQSLRLYQLFQECEADRAARLEIINQYHVQLEQKQTELQQAQNKFQRSRNELTQAQQKVEIQANELGQVKARIEAMESSKFWQLRRQWFRLKRLFGLGRNE